MKRVVYFKFVTVLVLAIVITSCSVQSKFDTDKFRKIPRTFSVQFYDATDTIRNQNEENYYVRSLMRNFTKTETIDFSKPVGVEINDEELFLNFTDLTAKQHVLKFYGKRYQKRFIFYTNYETITIPVLIVSKQMEKYSVYLPNDNEIIFEDYNVNEGMLVFFGAGNSGKTYYKFKLLNDE